MVFSKLHIILHLLLILKSSIESLLLRFIPLNRKIVCRSHSCRSLRILASFELSSLARLDRKDHSASSQSWTKIDIGTNFVHLRHYQMQRFFFGGWCVFFGLFDPFSSFPCNKPFNHGVGLILSDILACSRCTPSNIFTFIARSSKRAALLLQRKHCRRQSWGCYRPYGHHCRPGSKRSSTMCGTIYMQ